MSHGSAFDSHHGTNFGGSGNHGSFDANINSLNNHGGCGSIGYNHHVNDHVTINAGASGCVDVGHGIHTSGTGATGGINIHW